MAPQFSILSREGFTLDSVLLLLRRLSSPALLIPLLAILHPTTSSYLTSHIPSSLPTQFPSNWIKPLRYLAYLGLFHRMNAYLSKQALNNWQKDDSWNWDKETIVVTGGSAGIGKEVVLWLSRKLHEQGAKGKIAVLDIMELKYEAPDNVAFFQTDISSPTSISHSAAQIRQTLGHPTVLINNAGVCRGKHILTSTPQDLHLVFNVNTISHWYLAQEFLPYMIEHNHGHIVTVASVGAYVQAPKMVDYNASKASALSFYEGLTLELKAVYGAKKVRTTIVTPGYVRTELFEGYNNTSKFLLPSLYPETLAEEIGKAVWSGLGGYVILPRGYYAIAGIRGWFSWLQMRVLGRVDSVMDDWKGRQVIDPNEGKKTPAVM